MLCPSGPPPPVEVAPLAHAALVRNAAVTHGPDAVRAHAVLAGLVSGGRFAAEPHACAEAVLHDTPLGRAGTPDDLAAAVAFLAPDEAAFVTGAVLPVDGGYLAR